MVSPETSVNQRDLLGFRIVSGELAATALERKQDRRRMTRSFFAKRRIIAGTDSGSNPHPPFPIEHGIVNVGLAVPNGFISPIRRWCADLVISTRGGLRIADWHLNLARHGTRRIEDRQIVRAQFRRSIDQAVGVERGIPFISGDLIVKIGLGIGPVPLADDYVPLHTLWSRRSQWQFPGGESIGPIREHGQGSLRAKLCEAVDHVVASLARQQAPSPRGCRGIEMANALRNFSRSLVAHLMTRPAAIRLE